MPQLPFYITATFMATTALSVLLFYRASNYNRVALVVLLAWLGVQAVLGLSGFLTITDSMPPRFAAIILPPLVLIVILFSTPGGKKFIDGLNLKILTLLHSVRIVVELVLFWLFLYKLMPQLMTFEGRNLDILSGVSAPVIFYFVFIAKKMSPRALLIWNIACLCILAFTVTNGILSAPTPFQQFAFDQPNTAVLYFPYVWLPGTIVPLVYFSHFVAIRRLIQHRTAVSNASLATS